MVRFELIESRQMLSGGGSGTLTLGGSGSFGLTLATAAIDAHVSKTGTLHITGTDAADKITVGYSRVFGDDSRTTGVFVSLNGQITTILNEPVKRVSVQGRGGRDIVSVDLKWSVTGKLVGGKGKDVLLFPRDPIAAAGVYPYQTDPASIPVKGLITAYPIAEPTEAEKSTVDTSGGVNAFTHAGNKNGVLQEDGPRGQQQFITGYMRAWSGKLTPSRPAQLVDHGVYDASLINDLLFYGGNAFTPSEGPTSIVVTESDGSATLYDYNPKTDKVTVGIEAHFKIHYIDAKGNELREGIKGQPYRHKLAVPDEVLV